MYTTLADLSDAVHDPDFRQSWKDWESFVETLTEKISEIDETVPELPPKDLVCEPFEANTVVANLLCTGLPNLPRRQVQQRPDPIQGVWPWEVQTIRH